MVMKKKMLTPLQGIKQSAVYHFMYFTVMASNVQNYIGIKFLDVQTGPQGLYGIEISLLLM